jgi:hypothetical protein
MRDLVAGHELAIFGRHVGELYRLFDATFDGFEEGFADAEDVVAHQPDRAITVGDHAFHQLLVGQLSHQSLRGAQHHYPALDQLFRRQRFVAGALQADKLRDVLEVLAEHKLFALGDHGDIAHTKLQQAFTALRIVQYVDGDEIDFFARKKLFRPETAASPGLGEEDELFDGAHM